MILGLSIILAAAILALPLFQLAHIGRKLVAQIDDLNAAIAAETASIAALTTAIGTAITPVDLTAPIAAVTANRASVDALTTQLGGTPPPGP